jgi:hypothetical protein
VKPLSLEELDARAALQRRVDQKYLVPRVVFEQLLTKLDGAYQVLEIDGEREFRYESIYFDTEELLCFRQHVTDERPRFKARSRLYEQTRACVFEVKVKTEDGTMDKRHLERAPERHGELDEEACSFLDEVLGENGFDAVSELIRPRLTTRFTRRTFAALEGSERVTCDRWVEMLRPEGSASALDPDHILIESKSEGGGGDWDEALAAEGVEPISFSKYRLGIELPPWAQPLFSVYTNT